MKKLMTLAFATAVAGALQAGEWFNANISGYTEWPVTSGITCGAWSGATDSAELSTSGTTRLLLDTDSGSPLQFNPTSNLVYDAYSSSKIYSQGGLISATMKFEPTTLEDVPSDAQNSLKGGLMLVKVDDTPTYQFYGIISDGADNKWTALTASGVTPSPDSTYDMSISIAYDGSDYSVQYKVGDSVLNTSGSSAGAYPILINGDALTQVAFEGYGEVSELSATFDYAAIPVDFTAPSNVDSAKTVVKVGGNTVEKAGDGYYYIQQGQAAKVTFVAATDYLFKEGGESVTEKEFDYTIPTATSTAAVELPAPSGSETQLAAAKIDSTLYLTLQGAFNAVTDGKTITLVQAFSDATGIDFEPTTAISATLDLNDQSFTMTGTDYAIKVDNANLTIVGGDCSIVKSSKGSVIGVGASAASTLTLTSGTIQFTGANDDEQYGACVDCGAYGSFVMNGGTLDNGAKAREYAVQTLAGVVTNAIFTAGVVKGGFNDESMSTNGVFEIPNASTTYFDSDVSASNNIAFEPTTDTTKWYLAKQSSGTYENYYQLATKAVEVFTPGTGSEAIKVRVPEGYFPSDVTTTEQKNQYINATAANNQPRWVNVALGIEDTDTTSVTPKAEETDEGITVSIPAAGSKDSETTVIGTTAVKYSAMTSAGGTQSVSFKVKQGDNEFTVTNKLLGTNSKTLAAGLNDVVVSWSKLDGTLCKVSDLVAKETLADGDTIQIWDTAKAQYLKWTWDDENETWGSASYEAVTDKTDAGSVAADAYEVPVGTSVFFNTAAAANLYQYGEANNGTITTTLAAESWNRIANPLTKGTKTISSVVSTPTKGDVIRIENGDKYTEVTYGTSGWVKKVQTSKKIGSRTIKTTTEASADGDSVAPGTSIWYINNGKSANSAEWSSDAM